METRSERCAGPGTPPAVSGFEDAGRGREPKVAGSL